MNDEYDKPLPPENEKPAAMPAVAPPSAPLKPVAPRKERGYSGGISPETEITFRKVWDMLLLGNPFYLISAGLILYASTVIFNTANIWMETGIPVGILAAYTALCAATVIFIVRHGKVWSDARSLLFVILALPLALSAGLDDKLLSTPRVGGVWLTGSILFTAGMFGWVRRGLGIRLNRPLWSVFAAMLAVFFLWPLLQSRLVIDWPDDREPAMWGIILFPAVFALAAMPLLLPVKRGEFLVRENGTPWKYLSPVLFGLLGCAGILRSYLLSISFYPARGVGGYGSMESGFGGWMLLPILLVAAMIVAEGLITDRRREWCPLLAIIAGVVFFLVGARWHLPGSSRLAGSFYREAWGSSIPGFLPPAAALFCLLGYMGLRRVVWAACAAGALLAAVALWRGWEYLPAVSPKTACLLLAGILTLVFAGLAVWLRRRWVTLVFLYWLIGGAGGFLLYREAVPDIYPVLAALIAVTFVVGTTARDRSIEALGLFGASLLFFAAIYRTDHAPGWIEIAFLAGNYAVVLGYLLRRFWIPAAVESGLLLIWGALAVFRLIDRLEWRGAGIVFWSLLFFAVAFLISLTKGGILQKKVREWGGPLIRYFSSPEGKL